MPARPVGSTTLSGRRGTGRQRNVSAGRALRTVRISVTARCDLDCVYCNASEDGLADTELSAGEVVRLAEAAALAGARTVRLTGGEPLLRDDIEEIVSRVRALGCVGEIALTTNAQRLAARASSLRESGLDRVNVGLPSLTPETYRRMTKGELARTLAGLDEALAAGMRSVKVNVVLIRGMNAGEIEGFIELARRKPVEVRFIERMPFCNKLMPFCNERTPVVEHDGGGDNLVPTAEVRDALRASVGPDVLGKPDFSPTAELYRPRGFSGAVGFISPVTEPFCERCDRLRVTSDGRLRACLSEPGGTDIGEMLSGGADAPTLAAAFRTAFGLKPVRHSASFSGSIRRMGG